SNCWISTVVKGKLGSTTEEDIDFITLKCAPSLTKNTNRSMNKLKTNLHHRKNLTRTLTSPRALTYGQSPSHQPAVKNCPRMPDPPCWHRFLDSSTEAIDTRSFSASCTLVTQIEEIYHLHFNSA